MPNGAAVLVTVYGAYYLALEPAAGASWAVLVALPLYLSASAFWQVGFLNFPTTREYNENRLSVVALVVLVQ